MDKDIALRQYKEHTGTSTLGQHFKRIGNNVVDVFSGEGFSIPSRYRLVKRVWTHISGPKLDIAEEVSFLNALNG